jgi:hypothetical protein
MPEIDLTPLTDNGRIHNLSGKAKGQDARAALRVDNFDAVDCAVDVVVPADLYAISPSFFLGLFSQSLSRFGSREAFLAHYVFRTDQVVLDQINDGITQHFISPTALG